MLIYIYMYILPHTNVYMYTSTNIILCMFGNIKITCFKFCCFLLGTYSSYLLLTIISLDQRFATCSMCQYFLFLKNLDCSLKTLCFCCAKPIISSNFLLIFIKQRSRACNYFNISVQTNSAVQTKKDTAERDPSASGLCRPAVAHRVSSLLTSDSNRGEVVSGKVYVAQKFKLFKIQPSKRVVPCVKTVSKTTDMSGKGRKERLLLKEGPPLPKSR